MDIDEEEFYRAHAHDADRKSVIVYSRESWHRKFQSSW